MKQRISYKPFGKKIVKDFDSLDFSSQGYSLMLFATSNQDKKLVSWFVSFVNPVTNRTDTIYLHGFYIPFSHFTYDYPNNLNRKIALADYNLDGFLDLKIMGSYNTTFVLFVFDPDEDKYEANLKLTNAYHISVDRNDSTVTTVTGPPCGLGGGFSDSVIYKIENGKFELAYHSTFYYSYSTNKPNRPRAKRYKLITENLWEKYRIVDGEKVFIDRKSWKVKGHKYSPYNK